jgi:Spx/MgsR family transcriptional regulator|tara:strand:- start:325 stop:684 length:360 start_codon:yes stop_codon:yes gene_type:complete
MTDSVTIYGIANCDTIKKTKQWLTEHEITFKFHDYRKQGLNPVLLSNWVNDLGWDLLVNRRGTTWRQLSDLVKTTIDKESAIQIMLDNPAIIKRPLLVKGDERHVGFSAANYHQIFESK